MEGSAGISTSFGGSISASSGSQLLEQMPDPLANAPLTTDQLTALVAQLNLSTQRGCLSLAETHIDTLEERVSAANLSSEEPMGMWAWITQGWWQTEESDRAPSSLQTPPEVETIDPMIELTQSLKQLELTPRQANPGLSPHHILSLRSHLQSIQPEAKESYPPESRSPLWEVERLSSDLQSSFRVTLYLGPKNRRFPQTFEWSKDQLGIIHTDVYPILNITKEITSVDPGESRWRLPNKAEILDGQYERLLHHLVSKGDNVVFPLPSSTSFGVIPDWVVLPCKEGWRQLLCPTHTYPTRTDTYLPLSGVLLSAGGRQTVDVHLIRDTDNWRLATPEEVVRLSHSPSTLLSRFTMDHSGVSIPINSDERCVLQPREFDTLRRRLPSVEQMEEHRIISEPPLSLDFTGTPLWMAYRDRDKGTVLCVISNTIEQTPGNRQFYLTRYYGLHTDYEMASIQFDSASGHWLMREGLVDYQPTLTRDQQIDAIIFQLCTNPLTAGPDKEPLYRATIGQQLKLITGSAPVAIPEQWNPPTVTPALLTYSTEDNSKLQVCINMGLAGTGSFCHVFRMVEASADQVSTKVLKIALLKEPTKRAALQPKVNSMLKEEAGWLRTIHTTPAFETVRKYIVAPPIVELGSHHHAYLQDDYCGDLEAPAISALSLQSAAVGTQYTIFKMVGRMLAAAASMEQAELAHGDIKEGNYLFTVEQKSSQSAANTAQQIIIRPYLADVGGIHNLQQVRSDLLSTQLDNLGGSDPKIERIRKLLDNPLSVFSPGYCNKRDIGLIRAITHTLESPADDTEQTAGAIKRAMVETYIALRKAQDVFATAVTIGQLLQGSVRQNRPCGTQFFAAASPGSARMLSASAQVCVHHGAVHQPHDAPADPCVDTCRTAALKKSGVPSEVIDILNRMLRDTPIPTQQVPDGARLTAEEAHAQYRTWFKAWKAQHLQGDRQTATQ